MTFLARFPSRRLPWLASWVLRINVSSSVVSISNLLSDGTAKRPVGEVHWLISLLYQFRESSGITAHVERFRFGLIGTSGNAPAPDRHRSFFEAAETKTVYLYRRETCAGMAPIT